MIVSLAAIWIAFHILSGGAFLTSRNLWNLSVQSTSIAIMATGMVLIIVSRNIDLSVGSLLGFLGYAMALVQTDGIFAFFGISFTAHGLDDKAYVWIIALAFGLLLGALVGNRARLRRRLRRRACRSSSPSAASSSGAAPSSGWATSRARRSPRSTTRSSSSVAARRERSASGRAGWSRSSRARASCSASCSRAGARQRHDLGVRPLWVEIGLAVIGCAAVIVAVGLVANQYDSPGNRQPDRHRHTRS